jgi:hypothetical protein
MIAGIILKGIFALLVLVALYLLALWYLMGKGGRIPSNKDKHDDAS